MTNDPNAVTGSAVPGAAPVPLQRSPAGGKGEERRQLQAEGKGEWALLLSLRHFLCFSYFLPSFCSIFRVVFITLVSLTQRILLKFCAAMIAVAVIYPIIICWFYMSKIWKQFPLEI